MSDAQNQSIQDIARNVDLDTIRSLLAGAHFPADRKQIVEYARSRFASPEILTVLDNIPDQYYQSEADVRRAVAKLGLEGQSNAGIASEGQQSRRAR